MNSKIFLLICGLLVGLYFLWPFIVWAVKSYIYQLVIEYGFYLLILIAGTGFYLWQRLKS